jgi:hypothetical protein
MKTQKAMEAYIKKTISTIITYLSKNGGPGMNTLSEVTTNIYCSNYEIACNAETLSDNRIYTVISLGDTKPKTVLDDYKKRKIKNYHFSIADDPSQNLADVFLDTYELILGTVGDGRKILVHCNAGISRAPSIIIAYFLRRQYLISYNKYLQELEESGLVEESRYKKMEDLCRFDDSKLLTFIKFVKRARPCITPNPGFIQQMFLFERYIKSQIQQSLEMIKEQESRQNLKAQNSEDDDIVEPVKKPVKKQEKKTEKPEKPEKQEELPYVRRDNLDDLDNLEISEEEPIPLEKIPKTIDVVKGDQIWSPDLDNTDVIDNLPDFKEEHKKENVDEFDLDF